MTETARAARRWRVVRELARRPARAGDTGEAGDKPLRLGPEVAGCGYGAVTRRATDDVVRAVERQEVKLNALLFGALVSILLEIWRVASR